MNEKPRIIVVDDDESIRAALTMLLESEGYVVDSAENGKEAIEKTNQSLFNLAIVDYRLPDVEGTFLINQFNITTPKMMKIMLTGYPSMKNAIDAVNNHADAFIQKPVDPSYILSKIEELLRIQQEDKAFSETKVANYIQTRLLCLKSRKVTQG